MLIQLFGSKTRADEHAFLPRSYQTTVNWLPQIGDIFPNFHANTTEGPLHFNSWAEGHWSFLFSHPAAFTPVCTTEMVSLAAAHAEFEARNVKLLGFTASPPHDQRNWHYDISDQFGFHVRFPTVDDHDGELARGFGMIHEKEASTWPIRKSFILDPNMRVRMIFEYPIFVGRSTSEVIRAIDALQIVDKHDIATPADWQPGEEYLCSEKHDAAHDLATHGDRLRRLTPYLALIRPE